MATKTTKANSAAAPAPGSDEAKDKMAAVRAARDQALDKDIFVYKAEPNKKIAPQAQVIVNAIKAAGKDGIDRKSLVDGLKGVLVTRQPEGRILSYYQKLIQEVGAVELRAGNATAIPAAAAK